jgi:hypothetical protein
MNNSFIIGGINVEVSLDTHSNTVISVKTKIKNEEKKVEL